MLYPFICILCFVNTLQSPRKPYLIFPFFLSSESSLFVTNIGPFITIKKSSLRLEEKAVFDLVTFVFNTVISMGSLIPLGP